MAGYYWAYQDLIIWYPESRQGLQKACQVSENMAAWQEIIALVEISQAGIQNQGRQETVGLAKTSKILAAWQDIIGLAETLQADIQNQGGMARFAEGLPRF